LHSVQASTIEMRAMIWLWMSRFAIGEIGVITGLPDEGKGQVIAFIAAMTTIGGPWPMKEGTAPKGNVIMLSAEESPANTLVPRLKAAGADLSRIHIVQMAKDENGERMFNLATDLPALRRKIDEIGEVKLVTIDPVGAYFGVGKVDTFRGTDVRGVLSPLKTLAEETETAIIGVVHFNKKTDVTSIVLRISDSGAFGAAPRHVFGVINDPENARKLFLRGKNNSAEQDSNKALTYTMSFGARNTSTSPQPRPWKPPPMASPWGRSTRLWICSGNCWPMDLSWPRRSRMRQRLTASPWVPCAAPARSSSSRSIRRAPKTADGSGNCRRNPPLRTTLPRKPIEHDQRR
jgi:hypothetical protein